PARSPNRPLLVMAAAGRIGANDLRIEYGRPGSVGAAGPTDFEVMGSMSPIDIGPAPAWRNLRIPLESIPEEAEVVRVVARDANLSPDSWLAVTPPRNPRLRTLDEVVGRSDPVLIDWVVGLAFPCQRPFVHNGGVAETPRYRILADRESSSAANWWQSAAGGGPLLWTTQSVEAVTVPTYLDHDWARDWGSLQRFDPLDPTAVPADLGRGSDMRWGWTTPGQMNSSSPRTCRRVRLPRSLRPGRRRRPRRQAPPRRRRDRPPGHLVLPRPALPAGLPDHLDGAVAAERVAELGDRAAHGALTAAVHRHRPVWAGRRPAARGRGPAVHGPTRR